MKKIFYLASIAALAFSSCAKDETTEAQISAVNGGTKITAAVEADDTRTSLEKVDGKYEFRWSAGDQLGVYGVGANTLNNAAFVLENASDGKAVGVFASQNVELKADKDYVAVYPRFQTSLFSNTDLKEVELDVPGTEGEEQDDYVDLTAVKVTIPATQKYQNGTFYTGTVPAVSTEFFVNADGGANLSMQPVVDYLFVNIQSTEPIKTLTLSLNNGNDNLNIAGTAALSRYELGDSYRYVVQHNNMSSKFITLETDESYATVACHEPNTYVFAVPGGIFGTGYNVRAYLYVNKTTFGDNWDFAVADYKLDGRQMVDNTHLNWGDAKKTVKRTKDGKIVSRLENTVFWANPISVDTDGDKKADARGTFTYNPNGDAIISNEVELLRYINQYNLQNPKLNKMAYDAPAGIEADEDVQYYGKDAFLCEDGSFDFSIKNMMELATEYENTEFEPYIAAYLADVEKGGGFPCFVEYTNDFIGNGAVIENIEQPLLSPAGIFGGPWYGWEEVKNVEYSDITPMTRAGENVEAENANGSINDITFANVVAATVEDHIENAPIFDLGVTADVDFSGRGYILAGAFGGTIKNVTVKNADAEAIMGNMTVAQFNALKIEGVSKLANIADCLTVKSNLDMTKTWDSVKGVKESVFQYIYPDIDVKSEESAIHEITIAKGDASTYAKLTDEVLCDELDSNDGNSAVAVVIEGVSYWTGDTFAVNTDVKNSVNKNANPIVYYVKYAEELAGGAGENVKLTRNMDMNYNNLVQIKSIKGMGVYAAYDYQWHMVPFASLDGGDFSVNNIVMSALKDTDNGMEMESAIAPFDAPVVKNITLNNVYINAATPAKEEDLYVPEYIAGLTLGSLNAGEDTNANLVKTVISNATVNGLVIDTAREDNTNNTEANYSDYYETRIGWLVAYGVNAEITKSKANGVQSTVKGIAGLVAENEITVSSKFDQVSVANVQAVNTPLKNFADYIEYDSYGDLIVNYNVMGTAVGLVHNNAGRKADIKFVQCGEPVFLYNAENNALTVIYNNTEKGSFKSKDE